MSDMPGLEFDLGEMADTIRDTTERFAREHTSAHRADELLALLATLRAPERQAERMTA